MITPRLLKALHAEWRKLSPGLAIEPSGDRAIDPEREARLIWTNQALGGRRKAKIEVRSWKELTQGQARYLLRRMREESGDGPAYRAQLIARLAVELFGPGWAQFLLARLFERFRTPKPESLTPAEAHAEIEELASRIARRDGVGIEEVRARFTKHV